MNNFKLDGRTIAIGLLILVAAVIFLPRLFNTSSPANEDTAPPEERTEQDDIQLGRPVSAAAIDRDGCPVETTDSFGASEDVYVVAPNSDVPAGTSMFVRLYYEDTPIEDAPEIRADQDYRDTCINFVFEPEDGAFEPGDYEAEFYVNGNPAETIQFEIR